MASRPNRLIPMILIAVVAWMAFQYFSKSKQAGEVRGPATVSIDQQTQTPDRQIEESKPVVPRQMGDAALQALTVDDINLGQEVSALFDEAGKALTGVTDLRSAGVAAEQLGKINQALDMVKPLSDKLPPEGRQMLTETVSKLAPGLDQAIKAAYSIPGASDVLGDSANDLVQKLSALAGN